jgi:hypothetical protein
MRLNSEILKKIRSKRKPSFTRLVDIDNLILARIGDDYSPMFTTSLYINHGGEYCELLSIINEKVKFLDI